jgi:hypothetical protein
MTALATRPLSDSTDSLLRFAMRLDATMTGFIGLIIAAAANPLSSLTGLTPTQEYVVGAAFVLYGVVVYGLAANPSLRQVGLGVVIGNIVGTVALVAFVAANILPLTTAGIALTLATGVYTAVFAGLQYLGVRRLG